MIQKLVLLGASTAYWEIKELIDDINAVEKKYEKMGSSLQIEMTVEHKRYTVPAIIGKPQFYNPERKTSNPNSQNHE